MSERLDLLRFDPGLSERIWGGTKLRDRFGLPTPDEQVIGEAWLVADHAQHESVVSEGPLAGQTLRDIMERHAPALLGPRAKPTVHGRFPLLLKLLDSSQPLSVQVHPDDADAQRMGEPDVGKTEMWHVLHADPGGELICGLQRDVRAETLARAVRDGSVETLMTRFGVEAGTSVFVPAGTVHAVGAGIVLAEIQQNSDLTYRLYDWGRLQPDGTPRELHVDKALEVIHFGSPHAGPARALAYDAQGATRQVLAACRYFAAERVEMSGAMDRPTRGESFHIVLAVAGRLAVEAGAMSPPLRPGQAVLVAAEQTVFRVEGEGTWLDYYVPDLERDIQAPLRQAGHAPEAIARLGGDPATSDLRGST